MVRRGWLRRWSWVLAQLAVAAVAVAAARADGLDAERFAPAVGTEPGFGFEHPMVPYHLGWGLGLFVDVADDPVVERAIDSGDVVSRPLDTAMTIDLLGSIGFFGWSELGVHLPIQAVYTGDEYADGTTALAAESGVGDLRLVPKFLLLRSGTTSNHVLLGFALPVSLPTGNAESLRGADGVTVEPRVTAAWHLDQLGLGASLGYRWRSEHPATLPWADEIAMTVMANYALTESMKVQTELFGGKQVGADVDGPDFPFEGLLGVIFSVTPSLHLHAGGSVGFTDGIGDPDFRIVGGLRYSKGVAEKHGFADTDSDGVLDKDDECPDRAEDLDGFEDGDGCPEYDNDDDNIPDEYDECPDMPEEEGGDGDGCPARTYVEIIDGEMRIFGKVQFETGSDRIQDRSRPLLDQIAAAMRSNPQVKRIRIEGHTDDVGDESVNQRLSEQRAKSVERQLIERGIAADRLETAGFGESRPTAPNRSTAGRAKNRRVEFIIVESGQ